jgi:predicted O-methyltransferase YrrM
MHSPFVFDFIQNVLNNKQRFQPPPQIELLRKNLTSNHHFITVEDLGAGSRIKTSVQRRISSLIKTAVKPKKWGWLLYRLVKYYRPNTIIELGTSLGITTAYLATAHLSAHVITVEGSEAIHAIANKNFRQLGLTNIQSVHGAFDAALPDLLSGQKSIDLAYIDGNHRLEPTLTYFHQLLSKAGSNSIFIFDDIHWSSGMEEAWKKIKDHPEVTATIDLFFVGIVLFRPEFKMKQHFKVRF